MQAAGAKGVQLQGQPGAGPGKAFRGSVWGLSGAQQPSASTRCCIADHRVLLDVSPRGAA